MQERAKKTIIISIISLTVCVVLFLFALVCVQTVKISKAKKLTKCTQEEYDLIVLKKEKLQNAITQIDGINFLDEYAREVLELTKSGEFKFKTKE